MLTQHYHTPDHFLLAGFLSGVTDQVIWRNYIIQTSIVGGKNDLSYSILHIQNEVKVSIKPGERECWIGEREWEECYYVGLGLSEIQPFHEGFLLKYIIVLYCSPSYSLNDTDVLVINCPLSYCRFSIQVSQHKAQNISIKSTSSTQTALIKLN